VFAEFYQRPLLEGGLAIAPEGKSARCLILAASDAKDLQVLPREAWRGLAVGSEHAELRLMIAYALWDLSIAYAMSLNAKVLASDYIATALMAAAGAIAITGVCALRLPSGQQIAALKERARPDFEREQCNLCHQIVELGEWWRRSIGSISRELEKARIPKSILLRPSAYRLARTLLLEGDARQLPAAMLNQHMTYFDQEYAGPAAGAEEFGRILRSTLTAFNDNPATYQVLEALRYFERVEQQPGGPAVKVILRVAAPDQVGARSKSHLIGVVSALNAVSFAPMGTVGVDFDRKGRRRTIGS
jgi:hypothetical protein